MSNIYDLANELSRTLRDLPEYKAVVESKKAVDADSEAKSLLKDYLAFQQELQGKMKSFGDKIQGNPALTEFFNKQQQLSIYLADIERIIFDPVQELLK